MEERAALLNGTVAIQSRPGYGTEVEAVIPYHHNNSGVQELSTPTGYATANTNGKLFESRGENEQ